MRVFVTVALTLAAVLLPADSGARESAAAARTHEVEPGDTLWELAGHHGCSVEQLAKANDLDPGATLRVGARLHIPRCQGEPGGGARSLLASYTVKSGDTLSGIAGRHRTDVQALREANELSGDMIRVGQVLKLPGAKPTIRREPGQSIGRPTRGQLQKPAALPRAKGWHLRRPDRIYGAAHVVDYTAAALRAVRRQHRRLAPIAIGDLSARGGGALSGHRSHQSGRDVDIGLCFRRAPRGYPAEFVSATKRTLDAAACWTLVRELVATRGQPGGVERIFLDYDVQGLLYEAAREAGVSRRTLAPIFQYPRGPWARDTVVQHVRKHDDHLHVRFSCLPGDAGCMD